MVTEEEKKRQSLEDMLSVWCTSSDYRFHSGERKYHGHWLCEYCAIKIKWSTRLNMWVSDQYIIAEQPW